MVEPGVDNSGPQTGPLISILLPDLSGGGAERVMLDLARGFMDRGYGCELVLYQPTGSYLDQIPQGLKLIDLKASRTVSALLPLTTYLRRRRPMVLISSFPHTNIIAAWAARICGAKKPRLILTFHNMTSVELADGDETVFSGIIPWLIRRTYSKVRHLVAVSHGVARDLEVVSAVRPHTVKTIYNPCDLDKIRRRAATGLTHPWFEPGNPPLILALGRLVEQKDFPTLIKATALLRRNRPVRLMILGEGPDREALTDLARNLGLDDDFALPGFMANPYPFVAGASLLALSSTFEGFGLVLVEALALGTPVVATDCPFGPAEILDGGRYGELTPVGDEQALAEALTRTLDNPLPEETLLGRAEDFSLDKAVDRYLELVEGDRKTARPLTGLPEQAEQGR